MAFSTVNEVMLSGCYSRQEGMWWKAEGTMADAVDIVEWNLLNLLTVKHDKVIFEEEEGVLCDKHHTLFFIVPMINPTHKQENEDSFKNIDISYKDAQ